MADSEPPIDSSIPQVLLFGHVGAGKSSLLAALMQAGTAQGETLRGEVQEASGRLAAVRDAVYRGTVLERSDTELTSYTIRLRPWRNGAGAEAKTLVLHDCSGRAAESLIRHPSSLHDPDGRAPVARAVIAADAIILLVDATSNEDQLQEAFEEFDTFLTVVAQGKANAREVGGFPILLVLTKCDELVRPGDTRAAWEARVHHRAERAWKQFDDFLKDADPHDGIPSPFLPFGSVDLSVHAVAIRQPALADAPASPETPYHVAELFRDCFAEAEAHLERVGYSNRRLKWTVRAAVGLVGAMLLGALGVVLEPPQSGDPGLAARVRGYREHEPPPAFRLADGELPKTRSLLTEFRDDPGFSALPDDLRGFVNDHLEEIEQYRTYRGKLMASLAPGDTRTLEDLNKVEQALDSGELALPTIAWEHTSAGRLREKWLADARAIRKAEQQFLERYQDYSRRATALLLASSFAGNWRADVGALAREADESPAGLSDPLPDSPALNQPRGAAVTRRVPFEFQRVYEARRDWKYTEDRLLRLRDLADALALTDGPNRPDAALVFPEPGRGVNSATLPGERLFALRQFPHEPDEFREWELASFPEPGRSLLAERLERSFQTGTRHVETLLQGRKWTDTPEGWRGLADALIDPAFADWGRLLQFMLRLRNPNAANPIAELAEFLHTSKFDLDIKGFTLLIPPDLGLEKVAPSGALTISIAPPGGAATTLRFKQSGNGTREGTAMIYRFIPEGNGKAIYQPGDGLRAEVPVRSGTQEYKLAWESGGPATYQFARLEREPRLIKSTGAEAATGVKLTPVAGSTLPKLPALFPEMKK